MDTKNPKNMNRREMLKVAGGAIVASGAALRSAAGASIPDAAGLPAGIPQQAPCLDGGTLYIEAHPTSPFILNPFSQDLPNPVPVKPSNPANWTSLGAYDWQRPDCRTGGRNDTGGRALTKPYGVHQVGPEAIPIGTGTRKISYIKYPEPLYYRLAVQVGQHQFTNSRVKPILPNGRPVGLDSPGYGQTQLPPSTIYGFSSTPEIPNSCGFPGAMLYARYGQPVNLRLENQLDRDGGLDRNDFGSPELGFLTHLHNGHTACESDGQPHYRTNGGYHPGEWVDNLYLNFPPDNDPAEKQSFLWFHDHYMHHTGANVYKGLVGLYPLYDPQLDPGDERFGLRIPGVPNPITGRTDYDIPLAFYDVAMDDGTTPHRDAHNGCGEVKPQWWGNTYFRHLPNHGFVGDIFTTNCVAYPVLKVKRRKYRLRFLGASVSRIYDFSIQTDGKVVPAGLDADGEAAYLTDSANFDFATANWDANPNKRQGQWRYRGGQQSHVLHQIAAEGGLLPNRIVRNNFEIWPAKRREFIIDFSTTLDGQPTYNGQEFYLVNTYQMVNGRKRTEAMITDDENGVLLPSPIPNPDFEPGFCVPMMKIVIEGDDRPEDNSLIPTSLRANPVINMKRLGELPTRQFTLMRSGRLGGETEWLINDAEFTPLAPLAFPEIGRPEVWTIRNGGGGWVHPMHMHYEEHRVISRNGVPTGLDPRHPEDIGREDVVALEPSEEVVLYRNFRTFYGPYVAHCHNLAHEDHNMMFGFMVNDPAKPPML
jgi:FtsP/CotA-like multicopper oxidase with cupredoxin domain